MSSVLSQLFLVSVLSAAVISAVAIIKALFKNNIGTKAISLLWALVLLRLLLPYTLQSPIYLGDVFPKNTSINTSSVGEETNHTIDNEISGEAEADVIPIFSPPAANAEYTPAEAQYVSPTSPTVTKWKSLIQEIDFAVVLSVLWLAVGFGIVASGVFTLARFNSKLRSENIVSKKLYDAYKKAKQRISPRLDVRIVESIHVDMPITYGMINPRIIIPKQMAKEIDSDKLQLIIMHELMHIKRLDILKNYLWLLAKAIHWFNPMVWIAYKMYLGDMEIVCDTKVMQKINADECAEYSDSLVEAAKILSRTKQKTYPVVLNFCENKSKLRRRIMNILQPAKQRRSTSFAIAILICVLLVMCFTTACKEPKSEKPDDSAIYSEAEPEQIENDSNLNDDIMKYFVSAATSDHAVFSKYDESKMIDDVNVRVTINPDLLYRSYLPQKNAYHTAEIKYMDIDNSLLQKTADYFLEGTYMDINAQQEYELGKYYNLNHAEKPGDLIMLAYTKDKQQINFEVWTNKFGTGIYYARGGLATAGQSIVGEHSIHKAEIDKFIKSSYVNSAYKQASEIVEKFSTNMELTNIYAGKFVPRGSDLIYSDYDLYAQSDETSLAFLFTPKTADISSLFGQMSMDTEKRYDVIDYLENDFFKFEYILIAIDEKGVASFEWRNMRSKDDEKLSEVQIIQLEDAVDAFKANAFDEGKEWTPDPSSTAFILIDYIYLSMYPVADEDGAYTLYPVYAFSGKQTSGLNQINYTMIINAVDGSIIYQN
ncbi:MAG: M56 family metallopeptidase [Eubacteriales bacterium]